MCKRQEGAAPHNQRAPTLKSRQDEGGNRPNFNNAEIITAPINVHFLKDSEDRLSSLRRNTEGSGGRGGRRLDVFTRDSFLCRAPIQDIRAALGPLFVSKGESRWKINAEAG